MPIEVTIEPNPDFKPKPDQKLAYADVKARGSKVVAQVTAMEAVKNSGGMYRIAAEKPKPTAGQVRRLEDMSNEELQLLYFQSGGKTDTGKQMRRGDVIAALRIAMDKIQIIDDNSPEGDED